MPGERGAAGIAGPKGDRVSDVVTEASRVASGLGSAHAASVSPRRETLERRVPREPPGRTAHA